MKTIIKLNFIILMILILSGCTTARQLVGPEDTLTEDRSKISIKDNQKPISYFIDDKNTLTMAKICSRSKSAHDPVIWLPIIGPIFDLASIPDGSSLGWWEFPLSEIIPFFGPAIVTNAGKQTCIYGSFLIEKADKNPAIIDKVAKNVIDIAVDQSNQNCNAYFNIVYSELGELGFTDSVLNKLAGTGATIAGVAGTASGAAGLAAAGQLTSGSLSGVQQYFFQNATLPHLFSTISTTRTGILGSLTGTENISKLGYWGYDDKTSTIPYGKFIEFINQLDGACTLTQGAMDLDSAVKNGNNDTGKKTQSGNNDTGKQTQPANSDAGKKTQSVVTDTGGKSSQSSNNTPNAFIERLNLNGIPF